MGYFIKGVDINDMGFKKKSWSWGCFSVQMWRANAAA
jgi:hypothetical protein